MKNNEQGQFQGMPYPQYAYPFPPGYYPHAGYYPLQGVPPHCVNPYMYGVPPAPQGQAYHGMEPVMPPPQAYMHPGMQHSHEHHHGHHMDHTTAQAQMMFEGMMGEHAGIFKELVHKLGVDDKDFWKGAMIGAAAALLLSNEGLRDSMMKMFSGAGDALKSSGEKVRQTSADMMDSAGQQMTDGKEIFKDTFNAGKQGFNESVQRHQQARAEDAAPEQDSVTGKIDE